MHMICDLKHCFVRSLVLHLQTILSSNSLVVAVGVLYFLLQSRARTGKDHLNRDNCLELVVHPASDRDGIIIQILL